MCIKGFLSCNSLGDAFCCRLFVLGYSCFGDLLIKKIPILKGFLFLGRSVPREVEELVSIKDDGGVVVYKVVATTMMMRGYGVAGEDRI
ncbi:hypothetical protein RIF29_30507 [Crotalaria pallida]|uniref:Uncharacterized protein n=1 Tax=Crotalaria pallida TaxID=3830 RepID=A0AAN9EIL0_CROPI